MMFPKNIFRYYTLFDERQGKERNFFYIFLALLHSPKNTKDVGKFFSQTIQSSNPRSKKKYSYLKGDSRTNSLLSQMTEVEQGCFLFQIQKKEVDFQKKHPTKAGSLITSQEIKAFQKNQKSSIMKKPQHIYNLDFTKLPFLSRDLEFDTHQAVDFIQTYAAQTTPYIPNVNQNKGLAYLHYIQSIVLSCWQFLSENNICTNRPPKHPHHHFIASYSLKLKEDLKNHPFVINYNSVDQALESLFLATEKPISCYKKWRRWQSRRASSFKQEHRIMSSDWESIRKRNNRERLWVESNH